MNLQYRGNCGIVVFSTTTIPREAVVFFVFAEGDVEGQCRKGVLILHRVLLNPNEAQPARSDEATSV